MFIYNSCKNKLNLFLLIFLICFLNCSTTQVRKYSVSNAHAHNDYNHSIPFWTAYNAGFGSIEADIILRNGELYVAHDSTDIDLSRTLQTLYFKPLLQVIIQNKGHVYKDTVKKLLLLIDLKTTAKPTLSKLLEVLNHYKEIITCSTLKIVITGSQPGVNSFASYPSYIYFDGNLKMNYSPETLAKVALFSDSFRSYSKWNGEGVLDDTAIVKIKRAVVKAHALNKPIRLWAAPDSPNAWQQLMQLNLDYINTDKISQISSFLN